MQNGLVDALGGVDRAVSIAKQAAGIGMIAADDTTAILHFNLLLMAMVQSIPCLAELCIPKFMSMSALGKLRRSLNPSVAWQLTFKAPCGVHQLQ